MNLGSGCDYETRTLKISEYKLDDVGIVATKLLNAIKNYVTIVNDKTNDVNDIRIAHEKSGIFLEVKKSHIDAQKQIKNLVAEAVEQLKKPASDGKIPEYNAVLSREINNKIKLDGDDLEIRTNGTGFTRPCSSRDKLGAAR